MSALEADVEAAAAISAGAPGVTRLAWSEELFEVYRWLADQLRADGLTVEIDPAGNLVAKWEVGDGPAVVIGSHLDTVPSGGAYDGALGVLAGAHAIRRLIAEGFVPSRPIWLVAFMDEEGTRFGAAMLGSRAFAGESVEDYAGRCDENGESLEQVMEAAGFSWARVPEARSVDDVGAYLELHIEQGPLLAERGIEVGVVEGIVGMLRLQVTLEGQANHAGTTPMDLRRDPFVGAARIAIALRDYARATDGTVATIGKIALDPGGHNVIPGAARFTVDLRARSRAALDAAATFLQSTIDEVAAAEGISASTDTLLSTDPVPLDPRIADAVEDAAGAQSLSSLRMWSGAGHDAMVLGRHVPAAMVFVPSRDGISHNPAEFTDARDAENGVHVLAGALRALASTDGD